MKSRAALWLIGFCFFYGSVLAQTSNRTAVSVTGSDTATCTVPDPCRTFAVALSKTNSGGEVIVLTSGGYGPFTIDKAASIIAAPGVYAGLVAGSGNGITVDAGSGSKVVIRGLTINGLGSGSAGIAVTGSAAETHIESCVIDGFANWGIIAFLNSTIRDTTIRHCGDAIRIDNAVATVKATVERVQMKMSGANGLFAFRNAVVTARSVTAVGGLSGFSASSGGQLTLENCLAARAGLRGIISNGAGSVVRISNCVVVDNNVGLELSAGGVMESWGNNKVRGNTTDISGGALTAVSQN